MSAYYSEASYNFFYMLAVVIALKITRTTRAIPPSAIPITPPTLSGETSIF